MDLGRVYPIDGERVMHISSSLCFCCGGFWPDEEFLRWWASERNDAHVASLQAD